MDQLRDLLPVERLERSTDGLAEFPACDALPTGRRHGRLAGAEKTNRAKGNPRAAGDTLIRESKSGTISLSHFRLESYFMYWDVVEVKPEPGYRLFVRFKDGLAGRVQLRQEELTGALAPLLDEQFFGRGFIDYGAVAWPG